jgi:predicted O-linked N-acetylglucosamine transferase (SPINDLY family)
MGVPVVTLGGDRHAGRMVSSVLSHLQLSQWIAHSTEEYAAIVQRLAGDLPALASWRSQLRQRFIGSSICNGQAFAATIEAAFRTMWRDWCSSARSSAQ